MSLLKEIMPMVILRQAIMASQGACPELGTAEEGDGDSDSHWGSCLGGGGEANI